MSKLAAVAWTLITVTGNGDLSTAQFKNEHLCRDASSIAMTGETLDEYAKIEAQIAKAAKDRADKWRAAHPPRKATSAEIKSVGWLQGCGVVGHYVENGLFYDAEPGSCESSGGYNPNDGEYIAFVHGHMVIRHRTDIKTARCLK